MSSKYTKATPYKPTKRFHLSLGNEKIGKILNTNLLAGDDSCNSRVELPSYCRGGSCSGCCSSCKSVCYARKAYRYDAVIESNSDNFLFANECLPDFGIAVAKAIKSHPSFKIHRWHSSGEIINSPYINMMAKVCAETPDVQHYVYTKRYDYINNYLAKNRKPNNLTILLSPPFDCDTYEKIQDWSKKKNPKNLPLFIYDNGTDPEISKLPHCPAVNCQGHKTGVTCDKCQRCIKGMTTAVYAH